MQDLASLWNAEFPPDSLKRYADALNEHAKATFLASGTHVPMMFLFKEEGLAAILPLVGAKDKSQMVAAVRSHVRENHIYGLVHVAEAWVYLPRMKNDHTFKQLEQGEMRVSDLKREDQTEVLMLHMSSRDGASRMWLYPVTREGKTATLGEAIVVDQAAGGLFGNLFT